MSHAAEPKALDDLKVLELRGARTQYCGKLLADLGADVIKVEPPGGDESRALGPFDRGQQHRERSLHFFYFNTNKRSIVLDLESEAGRALFLQLAQTADIVLESFAPGYLETLGLGYDDLRENNPGLILASITGFGQSGSHAQYKAPDIVPVAMSGMMFLAGYPDDPPNRPYGDQGDYCAGIWGAIGILAALNHRLHSGHGQQVDVSVQEALAFNQETAMQSWDLRGELRERFGEGRMIPSFPELEFPGFGTYACKDGHIMAMMSILAGGGWEIIVQWMDEYGMAEELTNEEWRPFIRHLGLRELVEQLKVMSSEEVEMTIAKLDRLDAVLRAFFLTKTKSELYEEAQQRRLVAAPVNSPRDLVESPQFKARGYFREVYHPELERTLLYPGHPYRLCRTPARIEQRPPLVAEHNVDVYINELGLAPQKLRELSESGVV